MTDEDRAPATPADLGGQLAAVGPCELAVGLLTFNNAATARAVATAARDGLAACGDGLRGVLVDVDAGSLDHTPELIGAAGAPVVLARHEASSGERAEVPYHGVPGRDAALRLTFDIARRLEARALVVLEADVASVEPAWVERLARPILEEKADLVLAAYARHRYEGAITNLLLAPMVRALFGRRVHQPLGGAFAISSRLLEHAAGQAERPTAGRDLMDLWLIGTAVADGFPLWESWLGPRRIESKTRATALPTLLAQALSAVFAVMTRYEPLWRGTAGSEPVPAAGEPAPLVPAPRAVEVDRMVHAFRCGVRDLAELWALVLAPETHADVLSLDVDDPRAHRFPDRLWARVVYDFALGHHFGVVHREHLLRSLVPLYLGRTAAFVLETQQASPAQTAALLERTGRTFEDAKPYLVERWQ